eukprot:gene8157-15506_t
MWDVLGDWLSRREWSPVALIQRQGHRGSTCCGPPCAAALAAPAAEDPLPPLRRQHLPHHRPLAGMTPAAHAHLTPDAPTCAVAILSASTGPERRPPRAPERAPPLRAAAVPPRGCAPPMRLGAALPAAPPPGRGTAPSRWASRAGVAAKARRLLGDATEVR